MKIKNVLLFVSVLGAVLVPVAASAAVYAVKAECSGYCPYITTTQVCAAAGSGLYPLGVACNTVTGSSPPGIGTYACGGGTCGATTPWWGIGNAHIGYFCDDTSGNDAVVMCGTSGESFIPQTLQRVECNGDCNNVNLSQVCSGYGTPSSITCENTVAGKGTNVTRNTCGVNDVICRQWGQLTPTDPVGAYCGDTGGYDAIVSCVNPTTSPRVGVVKVECGGDCSSIVIGDVCGTIGSTKPLQIGCDDLGNMGTRNAPCGGSRGSTSCRTMGALLTTDRVGYYCNDGGGYDATVTCGY